MNRCICCKSKKITLCSGSSYFKLPVYHCEKCRFYFSGGKNHKKISENFYPEDFSKEEHNAGFFTKIAAGLLRRGYLRAKSQYDYIRKFMPNKGKGDILEIGSGKGFILFMFEKNGFCVIGVEPDKKKSEYVNKKLKNGKCFNGLFENVELKLKNKKFDAIILSHVLEHMLRPDIFLNKFVKRSLKKQGVLFLEVPNCQNKEALASSMHTKPHLYHFSKSSLENLLKNYKILSLEGYSLINEKGESSLIKKIFIFLKRALAGIVTLYNLDIYKKENNLNKALEIRAVVKLR